MGRMAKTKGASAEREVAKILQNIIDSVYQANDMEVPTLKRNLEQTRGGGYDLIGIPWLALEVKRQESLSINTWWEQTIRQANEGQLPVLIYRQNNKPWKVVTVGGLKVEKGKWVPMRVEIGVESFKKYFKARLIEELKSRP